MIKLLHKPLKAFTIYALIVLVCSIPVYYLVVDAIWLEELDEHNTIIKTRIQKRITKIHFNDTELNNILEAWNIIQPGTELKPATPSQVKPDSAYTITRHNEYEQEMDRFRGLSAYVYINQRPYHLTIETNVEEADETLTAIAVVTFLFFALLIIGFVLLNRRIAKKIWKPFNKTLGQLKAFDIHKNRNTEFTLSGIAEFEELNNELEKLIGKSVSAFDQQKTFIENASHELQTPLAILKSKLDLLLQNTDITADQSEIIAAIHVNLSKVTRINKNLLLLAKIENHQFNENETIDAAKTLKESVDQLADYSAAKNIAIQSHFETPLQLTCNKTLFEILANNLLINAIRHTSGNTITIQVNGVSLTVSNPGRYPLNPDTLFKRFSISSSETTNSGLGLAIVKEICSRYGWAISYKFEAGKHFFRVSFR